MLYVNLKPNRGQIKSATDGIHHWRLQTSCLYKLGQESLSNLVFARDEQNCFQLIQENHKILNHSFLRQKLCEYRKGI